MSFPHVLYVIGTIAAAGGVGFLLGYRIAVKRAENEIARAVLSIFGRP